MPPAPLILSRAAVSLAQRRRGRTLASAMARPPKPPPGVRELLPQQLDAIKRTATELATVMAQPIPTEREAYLREVTAVARAAVVAGEYREALRGYELLGEVLGHLRAGARHQHVHMHTAPLYHISDAELASLLQKQAVIDARCVADS